MKKLRLNYLIIGLLSLTALVSCNKNDEESDDPQGDIVGTWRAQSITFTVDGVSFRDYVKKLFADSGTPISDEDLDAFTDETSADADDLASVLEFKSGGTVLVTDTDDGTTDTNTWTISGNTLTIDDGDEADVFTIERLTGSELHLVSVFEDGDLGLPGSEDADIRLLFILTR
ncbi:MAG: lipocalin family protein [Tunicatimonas sp.]